MQNFLTLLFWILCGTACAYYAKKREKNPYLWFFIGIFAGIFGLLILFFMPQKKQVVIVKEAPPAAPTAPSKFWYYLDAQNTTLGPISELKLQAEFKEGRISSSTYVWNEDMENWKRLEETSPFQLT